MAETMKTQFPASGGPRPPGPAAGSSPAKQLNTVPAPVPAPPVANRPQTSPRVAPTPLASLLKAPSIILMGPTGTGKTDVLIDLISQGLELFVIVTEPNGVETLLDSVARRKADISKLHFRVVEPARAGFDDLETMFQKISISTYEGLSKASPGLRQGAKILEVVANLRNFQCQRTGQSYGNVSTFGMDRAVAIDSLSGLNSMAMDVTIGDKVTAHQGEWGIAMNGLQKLINSCTSNMKCLFVLTAHEGREPDELRGGTKIMVNTLGKKLAPEIPKFFSEVVATKREGDKYYWSTDDFQIDLKHRALPLASKITPGFKPIIDAYNKRLAAMGKSNDTAITT